MNGSVCTLHLIFRGAGVSPDIDVLIQDGILDFGYVQAGDFKELTFMVSSDSALQFMLSLLVM